MGSSGGAVGVEGYFFPPWERVKIMVLVMVATVFCGIAHDQVTVRISLEYFTVAHPFLIKTESPTLLALAWGVVATWWVGLIAGMVLSVAAQAGQKTPMGVEQVISRVFRSLAILMGVVMGIGLLTFLVLRSGKVVEVENVGLMVAWVMHATSYGAGIFLIFQLAYQIYRSRSLRIESKIKTSLC